MYKIPKKPILLYQGQRFTVEYAIRGNGISESRAFIEQLDNAQKAKILKIIKRFADKGIIRNKKQFKKVEGDIWEFKEFQIRVFMYHCAHGRIALTHGFFKKRNNIPRSQIERANQIKKEYEDVRRGMKL